MTKKKSKSEPKPKPIVGQCVKCKKDVTDDDLCHGCKSLVCEECNVGSFGVPWGGHDVEAHFKHYDDGGNEIDPPEDDEL